MRFVLSLLLITLAALPVQAANEPDTHKPATAVVKSPWPRVIAVRLMVEGLPITAPGAHLQCQREGPDALCPVRRNKRNDWSIEVAKPGNVRLYGFHDANVDNPPHFPGDYEGHGVFPVDERTAAIELLLPRLMHITAPLDNGTPIAGMLVGNCAHKPVFSTLRYAWAPAANINFAWDGGGDDTRYVVRVYRSRCQPFQIGPMIAETFTSETHLQISLPAVGDNEFYLARIEGHRDGKLVADMVTHDSGAHSWNLRFRVSDQTVPRWQILSMASVLVLVLGLIVLAFRRGHGRVAVLAVTLLAGLAGAFWDNRQRQQAEEEAERQQAVAVAKKIKEAERETQADKLSRLVPPPPMEGKAYANVGEIMAAWSGGANAGPAQLARYYTEFHRSIIAYADEAELVMTAVDLMYYLQPEQLPKDHWPRLAETALLLYPHHRRRLDNCVNCRAADTTAGIARNLGQYYVYHGRAKDALVMVTGLLEKRHEEISPHARVDMHEVKAMALKELGRGKEALIALDAGLADVGEISQADSLKRWRDSIANELTSRDKMFKMFILKSSAIGLPMYLSVLKKDELDRIFEFANKKRIKNKG